MRRPKPFHPRRPISMSRRPPRCRKVAAVELARVEYERARLENEMEEFCNRAETALRALRLVDARSRALTGYLRDENSLPEPPR